MQLLEDGLTIPDIAAKMSLTAPRTERYIEEETLARDLPRHRCDHVPVQRIRALFDSRRQEDPSFSHAKLAREANLSRSDVLRALGLAKTESTVRDGHREEGELQTEVGVETAARIVRALGIAPHEVPDL